MGDREPELPAVRNVRAVWNDVIEAWKVLSGACEALDRAIRAKGEARAQVARAYADLMRVEDGDAPLCKAVKRACGLRLTRKTRAASRRLDAALVVLETAEAARAAAQREQARALEACQQAKARWDLEYSAYARGEQARQVLGVSASASADEIKKAYRDAARRCHPDRAQTNEMSPRLATQLFKQLNDAFAVLSGK